MSDKSVSLFSIWFLCISVIAKTVAREREGERESGDVSRVGGGGGGGGGRGIDGCR